MRTFNKIWCVLLLGERKRLFLLVMLLFISSILELIGLALVIPFVNLMMSESSMQDYIALFQPLGTMLSMTGNYRIDASLWFAGFYLFKNGLLAMITFFQHAIQKSLHANVVNRMYQNYMKRTYEFHLRSNSSEVIRSITYDAMYFGDGVLTQSSILIAELFLFIGVMVVLSIHNIGALVILAVVVLLLSIIFTFVKKRLVSWSAILQRREANLISHLQEGLTGIKDVLVFGVRDFFLSEFGKNVVLRSRMKRNRDFAVLVPRFIIETLMMVGMAGALLWLSGSGGIEQNFATIAFFSVAVVRMLPMSNRIMASVSILRSCEPSVNVIYENARVGEGGKSELSRVVIDSEIVPFQTLEIENLSFSYVSDIPLISDVSFTINSGETIGIVGSSGAGKTTLVDLLLGLLTPTSGQILQNGCDIQDDIAAWQRRVGYVQQSIFLLDDTIEANIAFGVPESQVDHERVKEVIKLAKLAPWVDQLPDGIQSKVGERGVSISGGQRQRVGIARALYRSPELLMLDEATSALDNRTEKDLMSDIYAMRGEHTIILIAHRLDTIRKCDRIVVLDQGRIAGIGTYDELLAENAVFQQISAQH